MLFNSDLYSPVLHLAMGLRHNLFKDRLYYFQSITLMCNFSCGIKNLPLKPLEWLLFRPSVKDWVLRKRGLDVDNSCLNSCIILEKEKYIFLNFILCNFLVRTLTYFSIREWVLRKGGLDGDNSCLKFLYNFRKRKIYIFKLYFMQFFSADSDICFF